MTKQEIISELDAMSADGDTEMDHGRADELLILFLREYGCGEVADAWEGARKRCGFRYD